LRNEINALCLSCHDNSTLYPDVLQSHGVSTVRQAGALNLLTPTESDYPTTAGHTLGSTAVAPGGTWAGAAPGGLNCVNCHAAHGGGGFFGPQWANGSYRNLGGYGTAIPFGVGITYAIGTNDLGLSVFEDAPKAYDVSQITFNEPDPDGSQYADVCQACHTEFHGAAGGSEIGGAIPTSGSNTTEYEEFIRHPNLTSNIGAIGGGHSNLTDFVARTNQVHVMSPTGQRAGSYDGTDMGLTPSCMSCHKGHGNKNPFGLIYMVGNGTAVTEEGDGNTSAGARDLCQQCHVQGSGLFDLP
jgi:hypothetical protein